MKTARAIRLAMVWMVTAVLCGPVGVLAAEKGTPDKAAAPKKTAPARIAAPAPKPSLAVETPPKESVAKVAPEEGGDGDESNETGKGDAKGAAAGLPIPRFVSLRSSSVNLRTGPGVRYPVDWVYVRRHLPVEVIAEFDTWRQIRDPDGAEGWVHQTMLSGKRTAVVVKEAHPLKRAGDDTAETVATLEQGVIVNVQRCPAENAYCRVEVNGLQGWMKREQFWGVYPAETLQ